MFKALVGRLSGGRATPVTKDLSAELKRGYLYIGLYWRLSGDHQAPEKMFHVLLATVDPSDLRIVRKYHAVNPIDPVTKQQE